MPFCFIASDPARPNATRERFPELPAAWRHFQPRLLSHIERRGEPVLECCKASFDIHHLTAECVAN